MLEALRRPDFDIGIAGAGVSGIIAAKTLTEKGYRVALIDKDYDNP